MRVERALRPITHALRNLEMVMHANAGDANYAPHILDVPLDICGDAVGVIRNLANCQGP